MAQLTRLLVASASVHTANSQERQGQEHGASGTRVARGPRTPLPGSRSPQIECHARGNGPPELWTNSCPASPVEARLPPVTPGDKQSFESRLFNWRLISFRINYL